VRADVAATYGENLPATLSAYIERIPNPAPRAVNLAAQKRPVHKLHRPVTTSDSGVHTRCRRVN
jgi:hypothetical protein